MKPVTTCDACGTAVDLHAARCPGCGRFFDAVRCPRCAFQGPAARFTDGCPACGYQRRPRRPVRPSVFGPFMVVVLVLTALAAAATWWLRIP